MTQRKPWWQNIGRIMSERWELFDAFKGALASNKSDKDLIQWIKKSLKRQAKEYREIAYKEPLGSEFLRKIHSETDPLALVIKAHLFVESFLDEIIRKKFRNSEKILDNRDFSFYLKLEILRSKNYLDEKIYSDISVLNNLRNKFAHNLFYDISDFDISKFYYCYDIYDWVKTTSKEARRYLNMYMLRMVLYELLLRLTQKYQFIAGMKKGSKNEK